MKTGSIILRRRIARGDVLLTTPIIRALKAANPESRILVETDYPEIFRDNPLVANAGQKMVGDGEQLIDLTMAYENRPGMNFLDAYAEVAGVTLSDRYLEIFPNDDEQQWAAEQMDSNAPWCVIHADNVTVSKRWPNERWQEVITHLQARGVGVMIVGEASIGLEADVDLAGLTTIHQLAAIIQNSDLFIGLDSFPLHIAGSAMCSAIGLFGPTRPEFVLASSALSLAVISDPSHPCSGIQHRQAGLERPAFCETNPMETISVEAVVGAIGEVLP